MEIGMLWNDQTDQPMAGLYSLMPPAVIFGAYFCWFIPVCLPVAYDETAIAFFSDGIFSMELPGICWNNRNWPHVLGAVRLSMYWMGKKYA